MGDQAAARAGVDRMLLAIVAGVVGLIVVGLAVAVLVDRQPAGPAVDPASPVGVVQAYVEAINEGDAERAYGLLSRSARAARSLAEHRREFPFRGRVDDRQQRVVLELVSREPERAEVRATITSFSVGGPFATETYSRDVTLRLVFEDGQWRVDQPVEPYELFY